MRQNIKDEVVAHNITASTSISLYLEKNYNELQKIALLLSQEPTCDLSHTTVFQGDPAIEDLRLVFRNNEGNYYYETDNGDTVNLLNSAYYSQGVFLHKQTANLINDNFTLAVPVYGESTEVIAALEGCFNSNSLTNLLCGSARDCNICIVSQNCEIVCKSCNGIPDNLFDTLAVSVYDHNGSFIQIKDAIHDGVNGFSTEYSNSDSEKSFISLEPIDGHTNWCTLAYTDITMSNTTYGKVLKTSGLVLGLSVLLLIVLILILYKFMARSIKKKSRNYTKYLCSPRTFPAAFFRVYTTHPSH
ncbi:MAG: hypothetical protein PHI19_05755 [Clostridia bacterium]|nr:hypothetical protein [Clostridia bacterium]